MQHQATVQMQYQNLSSRKIDSFHAVGTKTCGDDWQPETQHVESYQYALPVRPALLQDQLNYSVMKSSTFSAPEYQLRRKTPAGTLDAAYDAGVDGLNIHTAKHLIVSGGPSNPQAHNSTYHASALLQSRDAPMQYFAGFETSSSPQNYDYSLRQYRSNSSGAPYEYIHRGQKDQYMPNVAQPPMQTPFSQHYAPTWSNYSYGFHDPHVHRGPWTYFQNQTGPSFSQAWQPVHGISPAVSYPHRNSIESQSLLNIPMRGGEPKEMLASDLNRGGMHSFAERASRIHYSSSATSNQYAQPNAPAAFKNTSREDTIYELPSKSREYLALSTIQQALFHSYGAYASLVAVVQETTKNYHTSRALQSRYHIQPTHIYPEPTRKQYYNQHPSHATSSLHYGAQRAWHSTQAHQRARFASLREKVFDILPESMIKAQKERCLTDGKNKIGAFSANHSSGQARSTYSGQRQFWPSNLPASTDNVNLVGNAKTSLDHLTMLVYESGYTWLDGMQLAGSLAFVLEDYEASREWFSQILKQTPNHPEATCNLGIVMMAQERWQDAEYFWRLTLKLQPNYFDAAEQLVTLLCRDQRHKDAVKVVEYMQSILRAPTHVDSTFPVEKGSRFSTSPNQNFEQTEHSNHYCLSNSSRQTEVTQELSLKPSWPEYLVQESEIGRMMALIHAKGNIVYGLHDQIGAAQAFEEVVLLASGTRTGGLRSLIELVQSKLSITKPRNVNTNRDPLLLPPETALMTAKLCFGPDGDLPGLKGVSNPAYRKSAISCTSNSLLSLAKICQDGISSFLESPQRIYRAGIPDILVLYYLSLSLQPSPSTANNVGILLANVQQASSPSVSPLKDTPAPGNSEWFMFPGVAPGSGVAFALTYYQYGLALDSKHAHLFTNLGSLLKDIGQLSLAIKMYEKAVECDGTFDIALANLANAVKDQGKTTEAITYYKRAVEVNPNFAEAVCGLANALNSICNWAGRGGVAIADRNRDRWHVDAYGGLQDAKATKEKPSGWIQRVFEIVESQLAAGETWGRGLLRPDFIETIVRHSFTVRLLPNEPQSDRPHPLRQVLQSWKDSKWEGARVVRLIERITRQIGWRWYHDKWIKKKELPASTYSRFSIPATLPTPTAPTVLPFHTFTFPMTAKQVRLISQRNALRVSSTVLRAPWLPKAVFQPPAPPKPHLNVGYVSSDFNNHPLAHLMQSVFGMHDVNRVKAFCYATTASDRSVYRKKIESEAPVFYDASSWSLEQLTRQIVQDGIHVLVNLNGYTRGARNEVFAARPAPIQMSFMGFAGSLGAEWCDYLLSDEITIPPQTLRPWRRNVNLEDLSYDENSGSENQDWVYSENIIYTRDTFFCCDHKQSCSSEEQQKMTWEEERARRWAMRKELFPDLSDDTIIFGNFNQLYKIDPTTFRTWLRILSRLPNSILWLLRFPDVGERHLRATATAWAGPSVASRIIFTDVAPKAVHIARACVADLFLDTPECNAHTTAADCLWSGTPILTLPRYDWKMCSRMAAGILGGALPRHTAEGRSAWKELVASSEEEYEEAATRLGSDLKYPIGRNGTGDGHGRLMDLRKMLWEHRWTSKLFDTKRWVKDLELAYEEAWKRWVVGEGGDILLKDIAG